MKTDHSTIEIARDLFMKYGLKSISMDEICKAAGISKKTIYTQVKNKAELIDQVVVGFIENEERFIKNVKASSKDALVEMINLTGHSIGFIRNLKPTVSYDLKKYYRKTWQKIEDSHFDFIRMTIRENIFRGKKEGFYREEINADIVSNLYLHTTRSIMEEDLFPSTNFSQVLVFENFIEYHLHGILNETGLKQYKLYQSNA